MKILTEKKESGLFSNTKLEEVLRQQRRYNRSVDSTFIDL